VAAESTDSDAEMDDGNASLGGLVKNEMEKTGLDKDVEAAFAPTPTHTSTADANNTNAMLQLETTALTPITTDERGHFRRDSKTLSYILRHKKRTNGEGLILGADGAISLELAADLLRCDEDWIRRLVAFNDKGRFTIQNERVAALQGHSADHHGNFDHNPIFWGKRTTHLFHTTTSSGW